MNDFKLAVIGAGPAGLAAGIQLKKQGYNPVIFEGGGLGGLIRNANRIDNYPGVKPGITGLEFSEKLKEHVDEFKLNLQFELVSELDFFGDLFSIATEWGVKSFSHLFLASGTKPCKLKKVKLIDCDHDDLFYEIVPIRNRMNEKIIIIGSGDIAFDYSLSLSKSNSVIILNRSRRIKANKMLQAKVLNNNRIKYQPNFDINRIKWSGTEFIITGSIDESERKLHCNAVVAAIGREPQKDFYSSNLIVSEQKLIESGRLYLIGDVHQGS
ncbi:MAG: FAD-dependent oxidoreductase, partial [bacterium]|nr:FAD-dependent oxidoreductase [bacterium]